MPRVLVLGLLVMTTACKPSAMQEPSLVHNQNNTGVGHSKQGEPTPSTRCVSRGFASAVLLGPARQGQYVAMSCIAGSGPGRVFIYSISNKALVSETTGRGPRYGDIMCAVNDEDSDGVQDLLVLSRTAPTSDLPNGQAYFDVIGSSSWSISRTVMISPDASLGDASAAAVLDRGGERFIAILHNAPVASVGNLALECSVLRVKDGELVSNHTIESDPLSEYADGVTTVPSLHSNAGSNLCVGTKAGIEVLSGADLSSIIIVHPQGGQAQCGFTFDVVDDIDGDGVRDIVAGSPSDDLKTGSVALFSGGTGRMLWMTKGEDSGGEFGFRVRATQDLDGDGKRDIVVSSNGYMKRSIHTLSSKTGHRLSEFHGKGLDFDGGGGWRLYVCDAPLVEKAKVVAIDYNPFSQLRDHGVAVEYDLLTGRAHGTIP